MTRPIAFLLASLSVTATVVALAVYAQRSDAELGVCIEQAQTAIAGWEKTLDQRDAFACELCNARGDFARQACAVCREREASW